MEQDQAADGSGQVEATSGDAFESRCCPNLIDTTQPDYLRTIERPVVVKPQFEYSRVCAIRPRAYCARDGVAVRRGRAVRTAPPGGRSAGRRFGATEAGEVPLQSVGELHGLLRDVGVVD